MKSPARQIHRKADAPSKNQRRAASSSCSEPGLFRAELLRASCLRSISQQNYNAVCPEKRQPDFAQRKIIYDYSPGPDSVSSVLQKRLVASDQSMQGASLGAQQGRPPDCLTAAAPLRTSRSARQSLMANEELALKPTQFDGSKGMPQGTMLKTQPHSGTQVRQDEHNRCQKVLPQECQAPRQPKLCPAKPEAKLRSNSDRPVKQQATSDCSLLAMKFPAFKELNVKRTKKDCKVTFGGETELASNEIYHPDELLDDPSGAPECNKPRSEANYQEKGSKGLYCKEMKSRANNEPKGADIRQQKMDNQWQTGKSPEAACSGRVVQSGPRSQASNGPVLRQEKCAGQREQGADRLYEFPGKLESAGKMAAYAITDRPLQQQQQQQQPVCAKRLSKEPNRQLKWVERIPERKQEDSRASEEQRRPGDQDGNAKPKPSDAVQIYKAEVEPLVEVEVEQGCGNTAVTPVPVREFSQTVVSHACKEQHKAVAARTTDAGTQTEVPGGLEPLGIEDHFVKRSFGPQRSVSPTRESGTYQGPSYAGVCTARPDHRSKDEQQNVKGSSGSGSWQSQPTPVVESDIPEGCQEALQQDAERRQRQEAIERSRAVALQGALGRGSARTADKQQGEAAPIAGKSNRRSISKNCETMYSTQSELDQQPGGRAHCPEQRVTCTPVCHDDSMDVKWIQKGHLAIKLVNGMPTGSKVFSHGHQKNCDIYSEKTESDPVEVIAPTGEANVDNPPISTEEPEPKGNTGEQQLISEPGSTGTEENGEPVVKPNKKCCC